MTLTAALELHDAGMAVIPVKDDGTKAPAVPWKAYIDHRATRDQIQAWFTDDRYGVGVITGTTSGGLEMVELEGRAAAAMPDLTNLADDSGLGPLWRTVTSGWVELSPSGGWHFHYRVTDAPVAGNTKLARAADKLVLAETRGEGGFVVVAPTPGTHHPTGKPWIRVTGGPGTCPTLTGEQRDAVHVILRSLDQTPPPPDTPTPAAARPRVAGEVTPGDDYENRVDWTEILGPAGWTLISVHGRTRYWRRPGKDIGISATTGHAEDRDRLFVFTTSTDFDAERPYTKFGAYSVLHHGGNHSAAARALRADGYGTEASRPVQGGLDGIVAPTDGNNALAPTPAAGKHLTLVDERTLSHSDDANALALIEAFGDRIRYCDERGRWLAWDGTRWHWAGRSGGVVREYAKRIARNLPETDSKAITFKKRSLGALGTTSILVQAATDNRINVSLADLDSHPWELNTPDGIVNLRDGTITPADPAKLHTRVTACAPDNNADPTFWHRFLDQTFNGTTPDGQNLIAYIQRLVGYSAVGLVGPHVLPFAQGSGGNGKGVFLETCVNTLGDYGTTAPSGFLMAKTHQGHETEYARLAGTRMVVCSEVNEDDKFDEAKVKQLTGGDTITARFMQQDYFSFTPSHQLWLMGNHQPAVRAGGRSFWRRLRLIPFLREVPEDQIIDDLQGILIRDHGPAILAWIIKGAVDYAQGGLREPDQVKVATAGYAHEQDTVGRFLEDQCILGGAPHVQLKIAVLRTAYERWCTEVGETPVSAKAFTMQLQRHDVHPAKGAKGVRSYLGVSLIDQDGDENLPPQNEERYL